MSDFDVLVKVCNIILMGRKCQVSPYFCFVMAVCNGAEFKKCQIDASLIMHQTKLKQIIPIMLYIYSNWLHNSFIQQSVRPAMQVEHFVDPMDNQCLRFKLTKMNLSCLY